MQHYVIIIIIDGHNNSTIGFARLKDIIIPVLMV